MISLDDIHQELNRYIQSNLKQIDWEICKVINSSPTVDSYKIYDRKYDLLDDEDAYFTEDEWNESPDPSDDTTMLWLAMNKKKYCTDKVLNTISALKPTENYDRLESLHPFYDSINKLYPDLSLVYSWIHIGHIGQKLYMHRDDDTMYKTILFFRDSDTKFYIVQDNVKTHKDPDVLSLTFDNTVYHGIDPSDTLTWTIVLRVDGL
jgi:hypothetical protein